MSARGPPRSSRRCARAGRGTSRCTRRPDRSPGVPVRQLSPGLAYFIPRAYPHHIEALEEDGIHFLIFFDQPTPGDIGYRATASAFSREVLSAAFGVPDRALPRFPFTPVDPLIVGRANPRDPIA